MSYNNVEKNGMKEEKYLSKGVEYGSIRGVEYNPVKGVIYLEDEKYLKNLCENIEEQRENSEFVDAQKYLTYNNLECTLDAVEKNSFSDEKKTSIQNLGEESMIILATTLNFKIQLCTRIIKIFDTEDGEEKEFLYRVKIFVHTNNGRLKSFETVVPGDKIKEVKWLKKATNSWATIPKRKEEIDEFMVCIQDCIETENVPEEIIYERGGWRNVPKIGWRYVYGQGMIGVKNSLVHARNQDRYRLDFLNEKLNMKETFDLAIGMRNICKNARASTALLLYVHASMLYELFKAAGYPLNFAFGVVGVTNSRKTSMVTTMAKIFNRKELVADAEFATASECGIEKTLSIYKDAPVIIDDFKPGINQAQQRSMSGKLDTLLRLCGNHVAKKRMTDFTPDGGKKYFPIEGGCVLTLELVDGVLSSLTRMFVTEIAVDDVQNECLGFYQKNKWILPTHIYEFLTWVASKFEEVVCFIENKFVEFRNAHQFSKARFSDCYATFIATAHILSVYALERNYWTKVQCQEFVSDVEKIVLDELENIERKIQNVDKGMYALKAITEYQNNGRIQAVWLSETSCINRYEFYENEKFFFIRAEYVRKIVNEYSRNCRDRIEILDSDEIISHLERLRVLDILEKSGKREKSRKLPIQRGNTLRYLYVKKTEVKNLLEE